MCGFLQCPFPLWSYYVKLLLCPCSSHVWIFQRGVSCWGFLTRYFALFFVSDFISEISSFENVSLMVPERKSHFLLEIQWALLLMEANWWNWLTGEKSLIPFYSFFFFNASGIGSKVYLYRLLKCVSTE